METTRIIINEHSKIEYTISDNICLLCAYNKKNIICGKNKNIKECDDCNKNVTKCHKYKHK